MSSECNLNNTAVPRDKENGEGWQQARLSVETTYVDAPVVLRVNGVRAGTLGNFSASIGKAKSKKSFNVSAMAAAALCGDYVLAYEVELPFDRQTVLYVDTEQSRTDCQNQMRRILRLAGKARTPTIPGLCSFHFDSLLQRNASPSLTRRWSPCLTSCLSSSTA